VAVVPPHLGAHGNGSLDVATWGIQIKPKRLLPLCQLCEDEIIARLDFPRDFYSAPGPRSADSDFSADGRRVEYKEK
jgi:hypothetical protein